MEKTKISVLGIIPARGGSKGVPRKNIRPLAGKSLIQRTFETARESLSLDRIVLSTDDEEIAAHGREIGLEVPYIRPEHLASDTSAMVDVIIDMVQFLGKDNYFPDAVMILQPTSPFRKSHYIDQAVQLLGNHDAVCGVVQVPPELSPHYVMRITADGFMDFFLPEGALIKRRQDVPKAYRREGTVYLTRTEVLLRDKTIYGKTCVPLLVNPEDSLSIDTEKDWEYAEQIIRQQHINN
ncbi:MAG: acylneuraminate cytidylyltransferase family protein [Bacteroidia bacterium]